jgi:eukaryotic-like serine/threonine-protein kinase
VSRHLRTVEIVLLAVLVARLVIRSYTALWDENTLTDVGKAWANGDIKPGRSALQGLIYRVNMPWALYAITYGVWMPNTHRIRLLVVGLLAAVPLALLSVACVSHALPIANWALEVASTGLVLMIFATAAPVLYVAMRQIRLVEEVTERQRQYVRGQAVQPPGGMGVVFPSFHPRLGRPVAVKTISEGRRGDRNSLNRFLDEAKGIAMLTHPSTVHLYDYVLDEVDNSPVLIMELIDGPTLVDLIESNKFEPLPSRRVVHILRQLCGALAEAHGKGIYHRDVKPTNIRLCRHRGGLHDRVKLLDFGLLRFADKPGEYSRVGTLGYGPPEQFTGGPVSGKNDMYSLGAVACLLLQGRWQFDGRPWGDIFREQQENMKPDLKVNLDPKFAELGDWLSECLDRDPAVRPDARQLDDRLAGLERRVGTWTEAEADAWWTAYGTRNTSGGVAG